MDTLTHYPVLVFAVAFVSLSLASVTGAWLRRRSSSVSAEQKEDLSVILIGVEYDALVDVVTKKLPYACGIGRR